MNIQDVNFTALTRPFDPRFISLRPGATTKEKDKALALVYADPRAYQERLDEVVGPANWSNHFEPVAGKGDVETLLCNVSICLAYKGDIGYELTKDPECWAKAAAMAFKRACVQWGMGRYLYDLPQLWLPYTEWAPGKGKIEGDHEAHIKNIYRNAGITPAHYAPPTEEVDAEAGPNLFDIQEKFWARYEGVFFRGWEYLERYLDEENLRQPTTVEEWRRLVRIVDTERARREQAESDPA